MQQTCCELFVLVSVGIIINQYIRPIVLAQKINTLFFPNSKSHFKMQLQIQRFSLANCNIMKYVESSHAELALQYHTSIVSKNRKNQIILCKSELAELTIEVFAHLNTDLFHRLNSLDRNFCFVSFCFDQCCTLHEHKSSIFNLEQIYTEKFNGMASCKSQ